MRELILLYWGCIFLMYLSEIYYPTAKLERQNSYHSFIWNHADIFMVGAILWMTCFSFLRTTYNDTETYIHMFSEAESLVEGFANGHFTDWADDAWSKLYMSTVRSFTDNYHVYFFFPALLLAVAVLKLCKFKSVDPVFSLLIFFSLGTYVSSLAILKQSCALFFGMLAVPYLANRKYGRFYLLVVIACLFHTYAAIFFILPLLTFRPWGKITLALLLATLLLMRFYDPVMQAIIDLAAHMGLEMKAEEIFFDHQLSIIRVLVYWAPLMLSFFFRKRLFEDSSREENIFANMSLMCGFIIMIGMVKGANVYSRMATYFEIAPVIFLPWMIHKVFGRKSAKTVILVATILYFGYFMFEFGVNKDFGNNYSAISLWEFMGELIR